MIASGTRPFVIPVIVCASLSLEQPTATMSTAQPQPIPQTKTMPPSRTSATSTEKTIYLVRHAESLENVACKGARNVQAACVSRKLPHVQDVSDALTLAFKMFRPAFMNAALSELGENQVSQLHKNLQQDDFWGKLKQKFASSSGDMEMLGLPLMVHSPLVRAKQTAYGALLGSQHMDPSELCDSNNDPAAIVLKDGVRIQELTSLREVNPKEIIGDTLKPWRRKQPKTIDCRIREFEEWIESRPEDTIVVVGHSVYFKRMLNLPKTFDNCDVWEAKFDSSQSVATKSSIQSAPGAQEKAIDNVDNAAYLPRSWKSLQRVCGHQPKVDPQMHMTTAWFLSNQFNRSLWPFCVGVIFYLDSTNTRARLLVKR